MDQLLPNMEQITYNDCKETLHMDTYLENNKKKTTSDEKRFYESYFVWIQNLFKYEVLKCL